LGLIESYGPYLCWDAPPKRPLPAQLPHGPIAALPCCTRPLTNPARSPISEIISNPGFRKQGQTAILLWYRLQPGPSPSIPLKPSTFPWPQYSPESHRKSTRFCGEHTHLPSCTNKRDKAQVRKPLQWDHPLEGDPRAHSSCASIFKLSEIFTASTTRELKHQATGCAHLHARSGCHLAQDCQHLLPWHFGREHLQHADPGARTGNGTALPDAPAFAGNGRCALWQPMCPRALTSRGAGHPQPRAEKSQVCPYDQQHQDCSKHHHPSPQKRLHASRSRRLRQTCLSFPLRSAICARSHNLAWFQPPRLFAFTPSPDCLVAFTPPSSAAAMSALLRASC